MRAPLRRDRDREQVLTRPCSARTIVYSEAFAAGVADLRTGATPRFDEEDDWNYERGRLWAVLAPHTMNPRAPIAIVAATIAL